MNEQEPEVHRSAEEIAEKIDEMWAYDDYSTGPKGENQRYKHQGFINALRWVLGSDIFEEP